MNNILKFILSFVVSYFIVVYTLQIPSLLTNNNPIIKENILHKSTSNVTP